MNKLFDEASLVIAIKRVRISDENLSHRLEAEYKYKNDRNFSAVCFIEFMAEKWGTKYFENIQAEIDDENPQVQLENDEPNQINTNLCVLCKNPRNCTNLGFLH